MSLWSCCTPRMSYGGYNPRNFSACFLCSSICTPPPTVTVMVAPLARCSWWAHVHVSLFQFRATVQNTGTAELEFLRCCTVLCNCSRPISLKWYFALFALLLSMCCCHRLKWTLCHVGSLRQRGCGKHWHNLWRQLLAKLHLCAAFPACRNTNFTTLGR